MLVGSLIYFERISVNVSLGVTFTTILAKDYLIDKKEKFQCVSKHTLVNAHIKCCKILKVCLTVSGGYSLKDYN